MGALCFCVTQKLEEDGLGRDCGTPFLLLLFFSDTSSSVHLVVFTCIHMVCSQTQIPTQEERPGDIFKNAYMYHVHQYKI